MIWPLKISRAARMAGSLMKSSLLRSIGVGAGAGAGAPGPPLALAVFGSVPPTAIGLGSAAGLGAGGGRSSS